MRLSSLVLASLVVMLSATAVRAQASPAQTNPPQQTPDPSNPFAMWNMQQMTERATSQVVKRYTLTPEQEEFTRKLMTTRVNAFLDSHEQEIRQIFAEVVKHQLSGNPPPPDKVKEWTAQITPMFDEAKTQILEGNREFREILSEDQKKIHDIDLRVMEQNFKDADKRLTRWREGGYDPSMDFGPKQPSTPRAAAQPPQPTPSTPVPAPTPAPASTPVAAPVTPIPPATPATPRRISGPTAGNVENLPDIWEMYVRKFIDNYNLGQAQSDQALQILADARKQATEYLTSHKTDYTKLQTQLASASGDAKATADINTQIAELNKPVQVGMFDEMKQRLDQIPTEAQRKAFEESQPKRKATATGPTSRSSVTSRPATSRPAVASRPALRRSVTSRPATTVNRRATTQPTAGK